MLGISVPALDVPAVKLPNFEVPNVELPKVDLPKVDVPDVSMLTDVPAHVIERAGDALGQARTLVDDARSNAGRAVVLLREAVGI